MVEQAHPGAMSSERTTGEPAASRRDGSGREETDEATAARLRDARDALDAAIERVIVGQKEAIELMLTGLFAGGHSILIGVPGLAKTLLVSTLSRLLNLRFRRIQFTPDLMPSDITGTDILQEDPDSGRRAFRFLEGPIFTNMLLADEINRTPPKTQAALLEAMQERRVTVGERTLELPPPFFVVATQNPIEQEGTYNLPEAQLDRFLCAIRVGYPNEEDELEIMKRSVRPESIDLPVVLDADDILRLQELVPRVPAADHVYRYALRIVRLTRPEESDAPDYVRENLSLGAGPRAAQSLVQAAKARALIHGRLHVNTDDVRSLAVPVLAHRLVTNFHADAEGTTSVSILEQLLADVPTGASEPLT